MRRLVRAVLLSLAALAAAGAARAADGPSLVVSLRPSASAPAGAPLRLADVAELSGPDAERAGAVEVGRAPAPGRGATLGADAVRRRLAQSGWAAEATTFEGAPAVALTGDAQPIDAAAARNAVLALLPPDSSRGAARLVDFAVPDRALVPAGQCAYEARKPGGGLRPGESSIPVVVRCGGAEMVVAARAKFVVDAVVVVATRDVEKGAAVRDGDLKLETRELAARDRWLRDLPAPEGLVARAALRAGQPVPTGAVARASAVEPGQSVRADVQSGGVLLSLSTVARGRGEVGAIIPVTGFDGHRVVRARVVAPGRVALLGSDPLESVVAPRGAEDRP